MSRAQIRIWIHEKDISKLEQIVWDGQGDKLLLETTNNSRVRRFLDNVPHLLGLIRGVHGASVGGDLARLKELKESVGPHLREEVFLAKDQYGVGAVMKVRMVQSSGLIGNVTDASFATIFAGGGTESSPSCGVFCIRVA